MSVKAVNILGSTGSVGQSTLDVIEHNQDLFDVQVLSANTNVTLLAQQAKKFKASHTVIADERYYADLKQLLFGTDIKVSAGRSAILEAASEPCDICMAAVMGFAGLEPVLRAIEAGSNVAIANKEPLVAAGPLVKKAAQKHGVKLLPVDSEHNAIFQVFDERQAGAIERIILTASGGPFRGWSDEQLKKATPEQAIAHPNWDMGRKISVDSATLMNKALEVIEAYYLFDLGPDKIDVVIHPQSIIHSMAEYSDGSILAQMGAPDMKTPIAYCLGWPDRIDGGSARLNLNDFIKLSLEPIDKKEYLSIKLAYDCLYSKSASQMVAFNAANEIAVQAFLDREIGFTDIVSTISDIMDKMENPVLKSLSDIVLFDKTVREFTLSYINSCNKDEGVIAA